MDILWVDVQMWGYLMHHILSNHAYQSARMRLDAKQTTYGPFSLQRHEEQLRWSAIKEEIRPSIGVSSDSCG